MHPCWENNKASQGNSSSLWGAKTEIITFNKNNTFVENNTF